MGDLREKVHLIMEFLWLWVPALVWVVLVEVAWTRAVDREPQPGPEDVELAEVCGKMDVKHSLTIDNRFITMFYEDFI